MNFTGWYYSSEEVIYSPQQSMNVAWVHPDSIADFCPTASNLLKSWQMWDHCNQLQLKCPWFPANVSCPMNWPLFLGCCYYLMRQWNILNATTHIGLGFKRTLEGFGFGVSSLIIVRKFNNCCKKHMFTKEHFFPCGIFKDCIWRDTKNFHHAGQLFNLILPRK